MSMPTVPPLYEFWHDGGFLVSEANGHRSRDAVVLTGGAKVYAGTVLGLVGATAPLAAHDAPVPTQPAHVEPGEVNVGNGTLTLPSERLDAPAGLYRVTFTSSARFSVEGPEGLTEPRSLQPGVPVQALGLTFTIAPGETKFAAGDTFDILVGREPGTHTGTRVGTSGAWCAWDPAATDGSQYAAGILFGTRDATQGDTEAVAITRDAEVNSTELIWASDAQPADIAKATAQLQALGILLR